MCKEIECARDNTVQRNSAVGSEREIHREIGSDMLPPLQRTLQKHAPYCLIQNTKIRAFKKY